jgi:uncharacterized protein
LTEKNFDITKLVELQAIEKIIYKKAFEINRIRKNEKLHKLKTELVDISQFCEVAGSQLEALEHERKKAGDTIKLQEEKIKNIDEKLFSGTITSAKELMNYQEEIKQLKQANENLEDKEIKLMIEIDEKRPGLLELTEKKNLLEKEFEEINRELEVNIKEIEEVISELKKKRLDAIKKIPAEILKKYDELRKRKDGVAVSLMKNNFCQACSVQISAGELQKIKDGQKIHKCPMCSRMLVINSDRIEEALKIYESY